DRLPVPAADPGRRRGAGDVRHRLHRRVRHRRSGGDPHQPGGRPVRARARGQGARPRPAALAAVPDLPGQGAARRPRPLLRVQRAGAEAHPPADAGDARTGGRRHGGGAHHRHPARPLRRPQTRQPAQQGHHGGQHPGLLAAHLLGRAHADPGLRRAARLAALHGAGRDGGGAGDALELPHARRPGAHGHAGDQPEPVQDQPRDPPDPRRRARDDADGLREVRPRQRAEPAPGHHGPRVQEHPDPRGDGGGAGVRGHHRLLRGDGEHLRLAGHGQAHHRQHQRARPAGDRRVPDDHRAHVHHHQLGGRSHLLDARPAGAAGGQGHM
ncbi:MAG: ABC transporter, permease protein 1 (cluster 5, nickel/peptides/opines), partial [uncultured Acetobacteraceae bacterium]